MKMINTTRIGLLNHATERRQAASLNSLKSKILGLFIMFAAFSVPVGATVLSDLAASMQPGEWKVLSTTGFNSGAILQPPNGVSTILEYTDEAQRNPLTKKIYIIGCARGLNQAYNCGTTGAGDADWIEYDEATNSWKRMPSAPINTGFHGYDHAAMDPATGEYYYHEMNGGKVWKYANGQLTALPNNFASSYNYSALEFFPDRNELVFFDGQSNPQLIHTLKKGASSWTSTAATQLFGEYHNFSEYSAKHKLLFIGGGVKDSRGLLKMDVQGNLTRLANAPVDLGIGTCGAVHTIDPISGNLVVFACNGSLSSYDLVSNTWTQNGTHPLKTGNDLFAVATPITESGVIFAVTYNSSSSKVYLYKHSAGSLPPADTISPIAPLNLTVQ